LIAVDAPVSVAKDVAPIDLWNSQYTPAWVPTMGDGIFPRFELSETFDFFGSRSFESGYKEISEDGLDILVPDRLNYEGAPRHPRGTGGGGLTSKHARIRMISLGYPPPFLPWAYEMGFQVMPGHSGSPVFWAEKGHFLGVISQYRKGSQNAIVI